MYVQAFNLAILLFYPFKAIVFNHTFSSSASPLCFACGEEIESLGFSHLKTKDLGCYHLLLFH